MTLQNFFTKYPKVALAFSGGVDSAFLLYNAKKYAKEVRSYYVQTAFQPKFEYEDAQRLVQELNVPLTVLKLDILSDSIVCSNPPDRCYYCKKKIFGAITKQATADGFTVLLDGTNADDDEADRPGMKALRELKVLSPLKECGLTKKKIRELSKEAGLFTWDKPAYACLATRIQKGNELTKGRLSITERAEAFLMQEGFSDFRVRMFFNKDAPALPCAKLQLKADQLELFIEKRKTILQELKTDYAQVLLDLETRDE